MAEFARRSLNKVTYAPIRPSEQDEREGSILRRRRGLEKISFANTLRASAEEIAVVRRSLGDDTREAGAALDAIAETSSGRPTSRANWRALAALPASSLIAAGRALAKHRRNQRAELSEQARKLATDYAAEVRRRAEAIPTPSRPEPPSPSPVRHGRAPSGAAASGEMARETRPRVALPGGTTPAENPWKPDPASNPALSPANLTPTFRAALDWARVNDPGRADSIGKLAQKVTGIAIDLTSLVVKGDVATDVIVGTNEDAEDWTDDLTDGFEERMDVEPVGRLHLERIDMTPVGILRGELMHSVGLAPQESVTLIHREWSSRETSFEKVVSEEFEQSTEEGVTENTELSSATETQSSHSSQFSTEASGSASYVFASASASVGYTSTSGDETAKRDSRNHSVSVTRKASARTRKEHKVTFTVKEQAGVEDQSVRVLSNKSETDPMRIDFHQLMRKWKVDLYRYGLRLTYDIVVPAPGIDLLSRVDEIRRIDYQLAQPFTFALKPAEITRDKWQNLAAQFGGEVEAPAPEALSLHMHLSVPDRSADDADAMWFETFEFSVPDGYQVRRGEFLAWFVLYTDGFFDVMEDPPGAVQRPPGEDNNLFGYRSGLNNLIGRSGQVGVVMAAYNLTSLYAQATLEVAQTLDAWRAWQHRAWLAMRKAAEDAWNVQRQELRQRRDQLGEELARWDPLSLRRMEREEIMKTTLKWIFGPAFDLMPSEVARLYGSAPGGLVTLEPSRLTPDQWAKAMGLGEFVKFLHQAIEWENVLFFVYPYFWDNPRNHALKRFLHHPDALHRAFLRGGAARVVLTVRPGFAESFTRLFETGSLVEEDDDLENHPYLAIAEEIRNYADTHYPGIPPSSDANEADPDEVEAAERGERIARWYEYTPVSALDITVNTPLEQMT